MHVKKLGDALTVELLPDTLTLLARACRQMSAGENEGENTAFDALAAAFTLAACSCVAYMHTKPGAESAFIADLANIFAAVNV